MHNYLGQICPHCNMEFKEEDDVVVCGSCTAPHHKHCWAQHGGCTTPNCNGTVETDASELGAPAQPAAAQPASGYTSQVGGGSTYQQQTFSTPDLGFDEDFTRLIGKKSDHYIGKFTNLKLGNKKTSWNWCSFLVAPYWLVYRKMYAYGAMMLALMLLNTLFGNNLTTLIVLAVDITMGMFGNYLYMTDIEKRAAEARNLPEAQKETFLRKRGDVSVAATVGVLVGYWLIAFVIGMLSSPFYY